MHIISFFFLSTLLIKPVSLFELFPACTFFLAFVWGAWLWQWAFFADGASTVAAGTPAAASGGALTPSALAAAALRLQEASPGHRSGVLAYAYTKPDRRDTTVMFWDQASMTHSCHPASRSNSSESYVGKREQMKRKK